VRNLGQSDPRALEKEVAGEYNTFRMYVFMLRTKEASSREAQNALGFSSTWLATHHLDKLENLGLVKKDNYGKYHVIEKSFSILRFFFVIGRWIVPHTIFLVLLFAVLAIGFLVYLPQHPYFTVALAISIIGLIGSIIETVRFYRLLPKTCS